MLTKNDDQETTYIVGGGLAGIMLAYRLAVRAQQSGKAIPHITLIDRHAAPSSATSHAYGGFISANSYETITFSSSQQASKKLNTPWQSQGGWSTHTPPTESETRWMDEVIHLSDRPAHEKDSDRLLYHHFGYGCIQLWQELMHAHPKLAKDSGFNYTSGENRGGVLRIYEENCGKSPEEDMAFLHKTGNDGLHTCRVSKEELSEYSDITNHYADSAQYVRQHGGNVNGDVVCKQMLGLLNQMGAKIEFMESTEVEGIEYAHNAPRINALKIKDASGKIKSIGKFTDRFVFATGPDQKLWKSLGFASSPVMGVSGTSLTVPIPDDFNGPKPMHPLKFLDQNGGPVIIPVNDAQGKKFVRIGGYTAFTGDRTPTSDDDFAQDFLLRQYQLLHKLYPELAERFLKDELQGNINNLSNYSGSWVGQRPVTADNHAIVGRQSIPEAHGRSAANAVDSENSYLLTGMGAAGLLSIGAADILAQQMDTSENIEVRGATNKQESSSILAMISPARLTTFMAKAQSVGPIAP